MTFQNPTSKKRTIEILQIKLNFLTRDLQKTASLINQLQQDDDFVMNQKFPDRESLADAIKQKKINTTQLEKRKQVVSNEIKNLQSEISKLGKSYRKTTIMYSLPVLAVSALLILAMSGVLIENPSEANSYTSHFVVENLRGDTIDTWIAWNIIPSDLFHIHLKNSKYVTDERTETIIETIMSEQTMEINDSLLHKGPSNSFSTYYLGWSGALNSIDEDTKTPIPKNLHFDITDNGEGHIIIELTNLASLDGYSGYTKSIVDEQNNQILKSTITIYDIENLSMSQLATILRHELGHGFGLAHSSAPEDLMAPQITTNYPYISDCDLDAITLLYDGGKTSHVICEK